MTGQTPKTYAVFEAFTLMYAEMPGSMRHYRLLERFSDAAEDLSPDERRGLSDLIDEYHARSGDRAALAGVRRV